MDGVIRDGIYVYIGSCYFVVVVTIAMEYWS